MPGPNPSELGKSQNQENPITRSEVKKNTKVAKFVAQNQIGPLKPERTVTVKEKVVTDCTPQYTQSRSPPPAYRPARAAATPTTFRLPAPRADGYKGKAGEQCVQI